MAYCGPNCSDLAIVFLACFLDAEGEEKELQIIMLPKTGCIE